MQLITDLCVILLESIESCILFKNIAVRYLGRVLNLITLNLRINMTLIYEKS